MTIQIINLGNYANDGTGDDLRVAFQKVNANFSLLSGGVITDGANLGTGAGVFAQRNLTTTSLEFKSLKSLDGSIEFDDSDPDIIDVKSKALLINDPTPTLHEPVYVNDILTNPLNLNHNTVVNGDVQTTVFGIDIRSIKGLLELLIASNAVVLDFKTFLDSNSTIPLVDMNGILPAWEGFTVMDPSGINLDFGTIV